MNLHNLLVHAIAELLGRQMYSWLPYCNRQHTVSTTVSLGNWLFLPVFIIQGDSVDVSDRQPAFLKDKGDGLAAQGNYR